MKRQFVQMSHQGAKAYYQAQKAERKHAAEHYRDHPEMLLSQVAELFRLPMTSMRKGLAENGIETDRNRQYGRPQRRLLCTDCGERVFHTCKQGRAGQEKEEKMRQHRPSQPQTMLGVNGKPLERTPEYIAYVESWYKPDDRPLLPDGSCDFSDDTPEVAELAKLGFAGLWEKAKKDLGVK